MRVRLSNPTRYEEFDGPLRVEALLNRLGLEREGVLVICDGELVAGDSLIPAEASVEVRSVISGG